MCLDKEPMAMKSHTSLIFIELFPLNWHLCYDTGRLYPSACASSTLMTRVVTVVHTDPSITLTLTVRWKRAC